jgi:hypothetical protein
VITEQRDNPLTPRNRTTIGDPLSSNYLTIKKYFTTINLRAEELSEVVQLGSPVRAYITTSILTRRHDQRYRFAFIIKGCAMKAILLIVQLAFGLGLFLAAILPAYPHGGD